MPTSEEVKAYFDAVAPRWDTMRQDYYGVAVIEKAAAAARPRGEVSDNSKLHLIIDVGCGTGFLSAGLAAMSEQVLGIDASPRMIEVAQENLQELGLRNIELRQGNVDDLPAQSGVADAAIANMVLHHAPDPQRMVEEMVRVTKPGGRVVVTDMDRHSNEWFRAEMADVWLGFTEEQVRQYMQSAGLVEVEFGWVGTQ